MSVLRDERGAAFGLIGYALDIAARKRTEEELLASREALRTLSAHLRRVKEEERTKFARALHDEIGQALTLLKMDLACLHPRQGPPAESVSELDARIAAMADRIDRAIQSVRRISADLRPETLDRLGLHASLEWQAEEFERRTGIRCRFTSNIEDWTPEREQSSDIFRIVQEALTNVARQGDTRECPRGRPEGWHGSRDSRQRRRHRRREDRRDVFSRIARHARARFT